MRGEVTLSAATLIGFLLVLTRMISVFVFVPMPVKDAGPGISRIVFAFATTFALFSRWPVVDTNSLTLANFTAWIIADGALGMAIGLMVSFVNEAFIFGAQLLGMQAGYGYASMVDPTTNADSDVLPVMTQLTAGLLFFTTGLHRYVIQAFAQSLDTYPPGRFAVTKSMAGTMIDLSSNIMAVGLRLALPVVGLLLMTDLAMALVGRLSSSLHVSNQAFPAKMLLALTTLVTVLSIFPTLYENFANQVFQVMRRSLFQ